jgi:Putative beta barrel porin-7 (BBP7)
VNENGLSFKDVKMCKQVIASLTAFLLGSGVASAQGLLPPLETKTTPITSSQPSAVFSDGASTVRNTFWGDVSYLLWKFKDAPNPVPLATTSSVADGGIIGNPTTVVIIGSSPYSEGWRSGYRLTLGGWLDDCQRFGVEASGFQLFSTTRVVGSASADPNKGQPLLAVPFFNSELPGGSNPGGVAGVPRAPGEASIIASNSANRTGSITASEYVSLWGAETNAVINLFRRDSFTVNGLIGFRYADLLENENLDFFSVAIPPPGAVAGPAINRAVTFHDHFGTRNQIYSPQIGIRAEWCGPILFASVQQKVAFGVNHETININGTFSDPLPFVINNFGAGTGGIFAQRTNSGVFQKNIFVVVPETNLRLGWNITQNFRTSIGYDFFFVNRVVRPGNQIDHTINNSLIGSGGGGTFPVLSGPATTVPFTQSNFWAQGASVSFEFRY